MTTPPVLILDNGAYTIKAGLAGVDLEPRLIPNSIARSKVEKRVFVGDEIEECRDLSGLAYRRPFEKGMLVNWDAQKAVWDRIFSPAVLNVTPQDTSLLVTEPYLNLPNVAEAYDQMVFEEWEFASYYRTTPAALVPYGGLFSSDDDIAPECTIIVDVGYSYTHVLPTFSGQILWEHVKRIDVGGKLLTNHLKHLISFRQWNMMDQTHVVNDVREACSYVTMDWRGDLEPCKRNPRTNSIVQEYVLPDFSAKSTARTGYIRSGPNAAVPEGGLPPDASVKRRLDDDEQVLFMGNERFAGPELLFHPTDTETIAHVIGAMDPSLHGMYWAHIGLFGGLGNIEALGERLERDLRALCPTEYDVGIFEAYDPATIPYHAAQALATSEAYEHYPVSRAEYLEHGSAVCRQRFGGPAYSVNPPGFVSGEGQAELSDDERERRYALGLEDGGGGGGGGRKGRKREEEEVTSGNWGGRRRRAQGL